MVSRKTQFVSVNLTTQARDKLQRSALDLSAKVGRRLSMSAIVLAAMEIAEQDPDRFMTALNTPSDQGEVQK